MTVCQKVPKSEFQSEFSILKIIRIFDALYVLKSCTFFDCHSFYCFHQIQFPLSMILAKNLAFKDPLSLRFHKRNDNLEQVHCQMKNKFQSLLLRIIWLYTVLKSLTSEATHLATPFFKRAYKISHPPQL